MSQPPTKLTGPGATVPTLFSLPFLIPYPATSFLPVISLSRATTSLSPLHFSLPKFTYLPLPAHLPPLLASPTNPAPQALLSLATERAPRSPSPHTPPTPTTGLLPPTLQMKPLRPGNMKPLARGRTAVRGGSGLNHDLLDSKACILNNEETPLSA